MKTETRQPRIDRLRVNDVMHRGVFMCEQRGALVGGGCDDGSGARPLRRRRERQWRRQGLSGGSCPTWTSSAASTVRDLGRSERRRVRGDAGRDRVAERDARARRTADDRAQHGALGRRRPRTSDRSAVDDRHRGRPRGPLARSEMATAGTALARPPALSRLAGHYLPDLVYGANDGIITTFAVVSGVVGASLSERVIVILGLANLVADGFSMGASNYLARRSHVEEDLADRRDALRHAFATIVGFVIAGRASADRIPAAA